MASEIIHTRVFDRNIEAYRSNSPLIVNCGGTRSGKSYSILQLLYYIAKGSKTPLIISCVSRALPHLKLGIMRDFENILLNIGENVDKCKNKTDNYYKIGLSTIEFWGTDNIGKVHGPQRDILFVNEANYIKQDIFDQLSVRTKKTIFIDFNPSREFWYHTDVQQTPNHSFIQSTYLDNNCLSVDQVERIESKKSNEQWWRVYGLGELGRLEDAILNNWDYGDFNNDLPESYGLDFGTRDPDAMVKVAIDKKTSTIYASEIIYQNELSTAMLGKLIKSKSVGNHLIVADSAATRTIIDLKSMGLNIQPVKKTPILDGIKMLREFKIIVDQNSFNLAKELNNWVWIDKRGQVPLDSDNHLIDAMRYICTTLLRPNRGTGHKLLA